MIFFYGFCCGVAAFGIAVALIELVRWMDRKEEEKRMIKYIENRQAFIRRNSIYGIQIGGQDGIRNDG